VILLSSFDLPAGAVSFAERDFGTSGEQCQSGDRPWHTGRCRPMIHWKPPWVNSSLREGFSAWWLPGLT